MHHSFQLSCISPNASVLTVILMTVHPCVCGEHKAPRRKFTKLIGSSLRVRVTPITGGEEVRQYIYLSHPYYWKIPFKINSC